MAVDLAQLHSDLLAAHAAGDRARLVRLYRAAADASAARGRDEASAFYLTHAYVFALDAGDPAAGALHARLKAMGRED